MKKFCVFLVIAAVCMSAAACANTYQKDIDAIYIYHSGFGTRFPEYKIDLKNKEFWEWQYSGDLFDYAERDSSLENEGFTYVKALGDKEIKSFLREASKCGLTNWKEYYINYNVLDGHQWGMTICFSDSTHMSAEGSNKYPTTWDKMSKAFQDLTGEIVLRTY